MVAEYKLLRGRTKIRRLTWYICRRVQRSTHS